MATRRTIPGGLRTQLLLGLCLLLVGAFALAAVVVENVITQRLLQARADHARSVLQAVSDLPPAERERFVDTGAVDAIVIGDHRYGSDDVLETMDRSRSEVVDVGSQQYIVVRLDDGPAAVAVTVAGVRAEVAAARRMLLLFVALVTALFVILGYVFFGILVVRPIRAIAVATERAADGDLASPISLAPRNEFGRVTDSFNRMLSRLDQNRTELESRLDQLTEANRDLAQTRDSLVRSEKLASVGQLAAGIAHEIGNPLAALSGYNELLREGELDEAETEDLLRRSGEQLDRIRGVIRNLLDFSRDDADSPLEPAVAGRCVAEAVSLVAALPRSRSVEFRVESMEGEPVIARPSQLVQVLVNLAMNAVDAIDGEGVVEFTREDREADVVLAVDDDGPGVPPADMARLFDPFFTTKDPGEGTGLGLAISARIIQSFGGDLSVQSSTMGGARFEIRLPKFVAEVS